MAAGIPVVAYDNRGHREIIKDQENGILVPMNDEASMAKAVVTIHNNESLKEMYTKQALKDIQKYNVENVLDELRHIYKTII